MTSVGPEVDIRPGFSSAAVVFEVRVTNHTPRDLRSVRLSPRPIPPSSPLDRRQHLIPVLRPRRSRRVAFRLRPEPGRQVVAMDLTVEWEDPTGSSRGARDVSSRPVDLACPDLRPPREGVERWRTGLTGGPVVELRLRQEPPPHRLVQELEEALAAAPGGTSTQRGEGPRGPTGRVWVRSEGARKRRAGLMVDVTPDPRTGGSRVLVTASASSDELLTRFYHACVTLMAGTLPGIEDVPPHSLTDTD